MTSAEHSDWLLGHAPYHTLTPDIHSTVPAIHTDQPAHVDQIDSVASVLKTLWLTEPPTLHVAASALTVNEGGSIALPISVSQSSAHGTTTVTIGGLASYEHSDRPARSQSVHSELELGRLGHAHRRRGE